MHASGRRVPLVAVGVWRPGTGFTRVLLSILSRLADAYEVHFVGIGYKGDPREVTGVTLEPCNRRGGDLFGAFRAAELVEALDARLVLLLNDLWILQVYTRALPRRPDRPAIVAYVPLDGRLPDDRLLASLTGIDRFVAYTEFGRGEIGRSLARLAERGVSFARSDVDVIPHGVDAGTFYPLAGSVDAQLDRGRTVVRRRLFPDEPDWHDAFVVLNANRPSGRKRVDLTIDGFARFARDKPPNVKLWLHHALIHADEHSAIATHAERVGIADRLRLTALGAPALSDEGLNLVYNACDVGLNTAMGEGWGLVSFEHAATGAAQVVPRHSACAELWDGAATLLAAEDVGVPACAMLAMQAVSADGVATALEHLYADRDHRRRMSHAAYRNALRADYSWDTIADRWRRLFDDALATGGPRGADTVPA